MRGGIYLPRYVAVPPLGRLAQAASEIRPGHSTIHRRAFSSDRGKKFRLVNFDDVGLPLLRRGGIRGTEKELRCA